ncbi:MAG: ribbon-helix-helix protein, CopG family [Thermoplasmatales archaeon]|nr:ribbon-helix-helix protein, CopG family [Thermoplasmatales archaeon]
METEKVTVRLPKHQIAWIDTLITLGEFSSRSEAIKRAVNLLLRDIGKEVEERKKTWDTFRELQAYVEEVKKYDKK